MTTTLSTTVPTMRGEGLSIAEAAERSGLTTHTLRYYERDGLMAHPVGRSSSGHRVYTGLDLAWITMLTRLRATGMPIREVRAYAALCLEGDGNESSRLDILQAHRARVLQQLTQVTEHLGAIDTKIGMYQSRLEVVAGPA
ncbi:MAG: MerR family transcriptional regulator [Humibacillus sp.]